jgi:hypothetical protein
VGAGLPGATPAGLFGLPVAAMMPVATEAAGPEAAGPEATGADTAGTDDSPAIEALEGEIMRPRADLEELAEEAGTSTAEEATSAGAGTPDAEAVR